MPNFIFGKYLISKQLDSFVCTIRRTMFQLLLFDLSVIGFVSECGRKKFQLFLFDMCQKVVEDFHIIFIRLIGNWMCVRMWRKKLQKIIVRLIGNWMCDRMWHKNFKKIIVRLIDNSWTSNLKIENEKIRSIYYSLN